MIINGTLNEKGRVYLPIEARKRLDLKSFFKKHNICSWHKGEHAGAVDSLAESIAGASRTDFYNAYGRYKTYEEWLERKMNIPIKEWREDFKKHGWKNLFVLGVITAKYSASKNEYTFLILYSPAIHQQIDLLHREVPYANLRLDHLTLLRLDEAGKITIPKSYRRAMHIDYSLKSVKSKDKYIEKKLVLVVREVLVEIWNPAMWKKAPKEANEMFNKGSIESAFSYFERIHYLPG